MCADCNYLKRDLASGKLSAAQADRCRTLIASCEYRAANPMPVAPAQVISDETLGAMAEADPTLNLD